MSKETINPYKHEDPRFSEDLEPIPQGVGDTDISYGPSNQFLLQKMLPVRVDFVKAMNWLSEEDMADPNYDDRDEYDSFEDTLHLMLTERETGNIIAGLRLTRVPSVQSSVSWAMLNHNPQLQADVLAHGGDEENTISRLNESAARGNLWDLTRLVVPVDGSIDEKTISAGIMELFATGHGAIKRVTPEGQEADIRWICNATELVKFLADRLKIQFDVAASGRVSEEDQMDSYFCVVKAEEATQRICANRNEPGYTFPYKHTHNGLLKANAL